MESAKVGRMLGSKLTNWKVRLHVVIVTAAIMALLLSALTVDSEIDHRNLSAQSVNESVTGAGIVGADSRQTVSETDCHFGHSCLGVIAPSSGPVLLGVVEASVRPTEPHFNPSGAAFLLYQPPRTLSQV